MSDDSFTEVSSTSWFGRIGESIKGILFGVVLVGAAVFLIFWNEGRAVNRAKTLSEGSKNVISVSAETVDPANEGKLVHLVAKATTTETLADPPFGVSAPALKLRRNAEMYQWEQNEHRETKKKLGGGTTTTTTYTYNKKWSDTLIDSSRFKQPEGHANPQAMLYSSREQVAQKITAGAFTLSRSLVSRINNYTDLPFASLDAIPEATRAKCKLADGRAYFGAEPASPEVGDLRVSFSVLTPETVSLVARQVNSTFEPYISKVGGELELLQEGEFSAAQMFQQAEHMNTLLTWGLRLGGALVMFFGFLLIMRPISVLADVIPLLGNIVEFGTGIIALILAAAISLCTAAVAWFYYRPLLSILLVAGAAAFAFGILRLKKRQVTTLST